MIQKYVRESSQIEELVAWMKTHPSKRGDDMPAEMRDYYERLFLANTWLNANGGSRKKVWPMLVAHYKAIGQPYSDSTARRDVSDAMELFGSLTRSTIVWVTGYHVDNLMERMDSCKRAGKDKEYALLSGQLDKWMDRYERLVIAEEESIANPIPILAVQDPKELGIPIEHDIEAKIKEWVRKRAEAKGQRPAAGGIQDAEFSEIEE